MRIVLQRVSGASLSIDGKIYSEIGKGAMILLGIEDADEQADADYLAMKIHGLRIFNDADGKMNFSHAEINGDFMVVSQFTLYAATAKGNRPSFTRAARPEKAIPLYEYFIKKLYELTGKEIRTGIFGADMQIALVNDGPVTIMMDSKARDN
jgi:D-tyrosyl-tRNA(Tyr) deacylase